MSANPFDQACRYLAKLEPGPFLGWLLGLSTDQFAFRGWIDARRVRFPGEPERTCDTVAHLERADAGGEPWAVPVEFQIEPVADMFGRLLGYLGPLSLELRPSGLPGDRFRLGALVVNLTGRGNASRDMRWPGAGLGLELAVRERNLAQEDADATLAAVDAGRAPAVVLPLIPLMHGGGEEGIMSRWVALASAEPDGRRRGDYAGLALVFAEAAGRRAEWKKALEGFNVIQSQQVLEWQAEALTRGRTQGELIGRIHLAERLLRRPVTPREDLLGMSEKDLALRADELEGQLLPRTDGST